ncbi:MAG TPA: hypothetical protein VGI20_10225 [Rhizomicrobium sp.]|jgi:hypothetical protein
MSASRYRRGVGANSLDHALAPVVPVVVAVAGLACLAGFARATALASLHVPLDPNEGWNAFHTAAAMAGHGLYPAPESFMINNYPPLSFYAVGELGKWLGDDIIAGRAISLASFVSVCASIGWAVRQMGGMRLAALFSALFFAGVLLLASDYVGMNDPQLLGHAIQLAALIVLLRDRKSRLVIFASAALFVAGWFVKHNLFALPLAALVWLALYDRRNALKFAASMIALLTFGLLAFRVSFGINLLAQLDSARTYFLRLLYDNLTSWLAVGSIPLAALAGLSIRRRSDPNVVLVALYAALSVISGAYFLGGAGIDVNAMFDADIALALAAGLALGALLRGPGPLTHLTGRALAVGCMAPLAVMALANSDAHDAGYWFHPMQDEAALASRDIAFLRAHPGPAMCESLAFCYWAAKPAEVDVFNLDQQLAAHGRNAAPFLRLLDAHRFAAIELDEIKPFPLPPDMEAAIRRDYTIDHIDDEGVFLVPRSRAGPSHA